MVVAVQGNAEPLTDGAPGAYQRAPEFLIRVARRPPKPGPAISAGTTVASGELNVVHDDDETLILTFSVIISPNFYDSHPPRLPGIPFSVT